MTTAMTPEKKPKRVRKPRDVVTAYWRMQTKRIFWNGRWVPEAEAEIHSVLRPSEARRVANWLNRWADWREQEERRG